MYAYNPGDIRRFYALNESDYGLNDLLDLFLFKLFDLYFQAKLFALLDSKAGDGVYHIPGFSWLFKVIPDYFGNLYGFYYLMYFSLIAVFGVYWAARYKHRAVWRRNLLLIFCQ